MREGATEAVLEFLGDTRVSCRTATRAIGPREEEGQAPEGEEGGAPEGEEGGTPPLSVFSFVFSLFLFFVIPHLSFVWRDWEEGD